MALIDRHATSLLTADSETDWTFDKAGWCGSIRDLDAPIYEIGNLDDSISSGWLRIKSYEVSRCFFQERSLWGDSCEMSFKPAIHLLSALLVAAVFATGIACENGDATATAVVTNESLAAAVTPEPASPCNNGVVVPNPDSNVRLVSDCDVLLDARDILAGDSKLNWSVDVPIAEWKGIVLGGDPLRVQEILLPANHQEWVELEDVVRLKTGPPCYNTVSTAGGYKSERTEETNPRPPGVLSGSIPASLSDLDQLKYLDLACNYLTGEIPAGLGGLANLEALYLSANELSGEIPAELGSLANLKVLYLDANRLSGQIPAELSGLANLGYLNLSLNRLSGEIPAELGDLANLGSLNLINLHLSGNEFTGCIPATLLYVFVHDLHKLGLMIC